MSDETTGEGIGGSGYTLEQLSEYHDRGREPRIAAIEGDAECQAVLDSMQRFGALSMAMIEQDAAARPVDERWFSGLMATVARELRAGRDIPFPSSDPSVSLAITEGAVRELVRAAGDSVDGVLVSRTALVGDLATAADPDGADPIGVDVVISVVFRTPLPAVTSAVRGAVHHALLAHTPLRVGAINITVDDVHLPATAGGAS
jgi:uncharacterized alkaline shock family protein YloU